MTLKKILTKILSAKNIPLRGEINIVFVGSKEIRQLNQTFLHHRGLTDVIAFPYKESLHPGLLGDIFVSHPVAAQNAKRYQESLKRELTRLVIHGLLHLLGYNDKKTDARRRMWHQQERWVNCFCPEPA